MRSSSAFVLVTTLVGCSASHAGGPGEQPDAKPPTIEDGGLTPPTFRIVSPPIEINADQDITYCYYFHTPNTSDIAIKKWASHMMPGVQDMVVYLTSSDLQTAGTLSSDKCGFNANGVGPVWAYSADSAESPDDEVALPSDDGNGTPVGVPLRARHSGFIQMHYVNTTGSATSVQVELDAYAYDDGVQVTPAGSFYTYSMKIDLPPGSPASPTTGMTNGNCDVPAGAKFYLMSAHTHKQGVHSFVKDDAATVFDSTRWQHPGMTTWKVSPFYTFASGKLTYQCEYVNPNNYRIQTGDNAATAETCIAVGYFFPSPAGAGSFCLDSSIVN